MSIFSKFFGLTGKQSQLKGIKKKKSSGLHLETLEDRQLLSVSPTGYGLHDDVSQINAADATSELTFTTFDVPSAVYGFVVAPGEGSEFDPGKIAIYDNNADPNHENPLAVLASNTNYNGMSLILAQLKGNGEYAIVVSGENETTGSFSCEVFLPGDMNGDNVVTTDEAKLVLGGYKTQSEFLDPHVTPGQQETQFVYPMLYGASYEYIVANMGKFDLNFDGTVNQLDYDQIALVNQTASGQLASGNDFQQGTDLVADQDSPIITPPKNTETVVEEESGDPDDPTIDVYTTKPEDAKITAQDPTSAIDAVSVTVGDKTYDLNDDEMTIDPETGEVTVSLDNIFDAMERVDGTRPGAGTYPITITFTDEYDHSSSLDLTIAYEDVPTAVDPILNPQADQEGFDDAGAEKEGYPVVSISTKTSLQEFVSGTDAAALIYLQDGSQARFKEVTNGTVQYWNYTLDTPAWVTATGVTYTLSETGDIQIVYAEGTDPFAWLSTFESQVNDQATNKVVLKVAFDAANIYYKNSEDTNHWKSGTLQVELKPENDLPTAAADTANVSEKATEATSQVVTVLANDSDPDKWDEFTAIGIQFKGQNYFFKDSANTAGTEYGDYEGSKYIEITPDGATKAIRVLQYNSADASQLHEQANKLAIDLQGAYSWLSESETKAFSFSYIMTDAANKDMTEIDMTKCSVGTVTMTVNGVNDPPVAADTTFDNVNENDNTGKVTPVVTDTDTTNTYALAVDDTPVTDWNDRAVNIVALSDSADKTAIIQAAADALTDSDILACIELVNTGLAEGEKPYFKFNPIKDSASLFNFLGVGETLTLTVKYYATDNSGTESNRADLTVTITGVNNTPVVTGWEVSEIEGDTINSSTITLQKADPSTDPATNGWSDADLNDTQVFYQFQTFENEGGTWALKWKELTNVNQDVRDINGELVGTVKFGVTEGETDMTKVLYTPSNNIKWDTSDIENPMSKADLSFTIKDSSGVTEGDYTGISDPFTVSVPIKGVYNAPELFDARDMTISVSKTDQLDAQKTVDEQKVAGTVDATVDAGYTGAWTITKATIPNAADSDNPIDVSSYFKITTTTGTDAKTGLTVTYGTVSWAGDTEADQQANQLLFHQTYMDIVGSEVNSLDITFAASLTDNHDPASTIATGDLTLSAVKKTPPTVGYQEGIETKLIGTAEVAISGQTANENDTTAKAFDLDTLYTVKDGETGEATTDYEYVSLSLDLAKSTVKNGETTTPLVDIFGADGPFTSGEYSVASNGDFSMELQRLTAQIFEQLAIKREVHDNCELVFSVKVHDTTADATCTTTVYFTVNVTGENDAPTVTDTENLGGFDDVGPSNVIDVKLVDTYADDIDWSDVLSISDKALADTGTIDGVTKTAAEMAEYFGLSVDDLNALLTFTEGTAPGAAGSGTFSYAYNEAFKKLPVKQVEGAWVGVEAVLKYTMNVIDNNGGSAQKTVSITITGTNQAPSALVTQTYLVDLQSVQEDQTYDIVGTEITDIDTGDVLTPALTFVNIVMGDTATEEFGTECSAISVNATTKLVEIDVDALNTQFAKLAKGQTVTVNFTYSVTDPAGLASEATNNTFTITITGRNEQPTVDNIANQNVTMNPDDEAINTKVVIDWSESASDQDTLPAANADTLTLYQIYGIDGDQLALAKSWIDVSDVDAAGEVRTVYVFDDNDNLQGKVVVSWDTTNSKQVMEFYPVAEVMIGGATQSTLDTYKWKLDADDAALDYSFQFKVIDSNKIGIPGDQNQTSVSDAATVSGAITGVFDKLVLTLPTELKTVPTQGKVVEFEGVDYLTLSGSYTWQCEEGHEDNYVFTIDSVTAKDDTDPGTLTAGDFKVTKNPDGTLTLYLKKAAAEANVEKSFVVSVKYDNTTDSDTASESFDIKVIEKSEPVIAPTNITLDPIAEQTTGTTSYDLTANVEVTDGDGLGKAASFTVNTNNALSLKGTGTDSSYTLEELDSIAGTISNCASIVKDEATGHYQFQFNNTYVDEQSLFAFLAADQKLELVFEYEVDSYTMSDGQKFEIPAKATVMVTINGQNNAPVGVDVTWGTVIAGSTESVGMGIADLFTQNGDETPGFAYDVDAANKELTTLYNLRHSNINTNTLIISGYATAGGTEKTEITLTASDAASATKVYLISGVANSPYVTLELDGTTPKLVYYSNGYYDFRPVTESVYDDTLTIDYKVIDNANVSSAALEQLTLQVKGDYVKPAPVENPSPVLGDVVGYNSSTGKVTKNLSEYFTSVDNLDLTKLELNLPSTITDILARYRYDETTSTFVKDMTYRYDKPTDTVIPNGEIVEGYSYGFDTAAKTVWFQFIAQEDYSKEIYNEKTYGTGNAVYRGDYFNLDQMIMSISCKDKAGDTIDSNSFSVVCNQHTTVEMALVGTDYIPTGGTLPGEIEITSDYSQWVRYIDSGTFNTYRTTSSEIVPDANNGYYVEVWLRDDLIEKFDVDPFNGTRHVHFILTYEGNAVANIISPYASTVKASIGWGMSVKELSTKWYSDVRDATTGTSLDAVFVEMTIPYGTLQKGTDGTAVLLCRFYVTLKEGKTAVEAKLGIDPYSNTKYSIYTTEGNQFEATAGYAYVRCGYDSAMNLNNSQFNASYQVYHTLQLMGTTVTEEVVDGGIYVRSVTEATESNIVADIPENTDFINEWQTHYGEIWVKLSAYDFTTGADVVFKYNPKLFTPTEVEVGGLFTGEGIIDYEAGTITLSADAAAGMITDSGYALLGRVTFKATDVQYENAQGQMVSTKVTGISAKDATKPFALDWSLSRGTTHYLKTEDVESYLGVESSTEVWAVPYDLNDDNMITATDVLLMYDVYGINYNDERYQANYDLNEDGVLSAYDVLYIYDYYGVARDHVVNGLEFKLPVAFTQRYVGSTLRTTDDVAMVGYTLDAANEAWREALGLEEAIDVQLIVGDYDGESELGKAVITAWDANGIPSAGTIYLDDDANGVTWLAQLEGSVEGSAKYDLYTVLLHELGHLYGYDAENDAFAAVVDQFDFITEEGHSTVASDVMSSTLQPGQRKELSTNDVYVVATAYANATENYSVPTALVQAWSAQNVVESSVAAVLPEEGNTENTCVDNLDLINSDIKTTRSTLEQLNSLGINVPSITVIEDKGDVVDQSVNDMFVQDDEDDEEDEIFIPEESALPNNGYENLLDSVMNDYEL